MKIGLTLDDTLRDTIVALCKVFDKYDIGEYDDFESIDINNLEKSFRIREDYKDADSLKDLLYNKSSFEIFGSADIIDQNMAIEKLNDFLYDFYFFKENTFTILSKEIARSVYSTYYFISKAGLDVKTVEIVNEWTSIWEQYDIIITANPVIIASKPEGKIVIKINTPYNTDVKADYTYDSLKDVFGDGEYITKYK